MRRNNLISFFFGLVFLGGALFYLEWTDPFYFAQDDNFAQFLPVIIQSCRGFFQDGTFPTWNPYQLMGMPSWSVGTYALSYPITYFSYAIAHFILANANWTIDVFCILHLVLGYVVLFYFLRFLKVESPWAMAGALCFILSGFNLIGGRSWYYMIPVAFWAPLLFYFAIKVLKSENLKKLLLYNVLFGLSVGIFFHAGNAQMWIYTFIFMFFYIGLLFLTKKVSWKQILHLLPGVFIGFSILCILLFPQLEVTSYSKRNPWGNGIMRGLISLILPYPLSGATHPQGWGSAFTQDMAQFYYSGTTFMLASLAGFVGFIFLMIKNRFKNLVFHFSHEKIWIVLFGISFLFSTGGIFWDALSSLPFLNRMSCPFKFLMFANLFSIIAGTKVIQTFFINKSSKLKNVIITATLLLLAYHVTHVRTAFYSYKDDPYPVLSEKMKENLSDDKFRIISFAPDRSIDKNYARLMKHNFPSVYGLLSFDGYEPFVSGLPIHSKMSDLLNRNPGEGLVKYGIQCIIVRETDMFRINKLFLKMRVFLELASEEGSIQVYKTKKKVDPLVFDLKDDSTDFGIKYKNNGFLVTLLPSDQKQNLVFNFAYDIHFKIFADEKPVSFAADNWGRILVKIPAQTKQVEVFYVPPLKKGFVFSGIFLFLGVGSLFMLRKNHAKTSN